MINATATASSIIDNFREKYATHFSISFRFDDCRITVHTNASELVEKLHVYFREFMGDDGKPDIEVTAIEAAEQFPDLSFIIKKPDPGKNKIKEEYVDFPDGRLVRKKLTGMLFVFSGKDNLGIGGCMANDNQVINFIISRYIQWTLHRGGLLLHSAAIEKDGKGVALAGFSGMGKSTLALHLMSRGLTFVSNDRLMIRPDGNGVRMYGVPKLPRINPGTALNNPDLVEVIMEENRKKFSQLKENELWELEQKYDVYIDEVFGAGKFVLSASMQGLVILNWKRNGEKAEPRPVPLSERLDLFPAFTKSTGLFYAEDPLSPSPDFSDSAYCELLKNVHVLEISGGVDFEAAATACMTLINGA